MSSGAEEMAALRPRRGGMVKWIAVLVIVIVAVVIVAGALAGWFNGPPITIVGAGASFPQPLIAKWARVYVNGTGVRVDYASLGGGAGISPITAKTVDFGARAAPLEAAER